MINKRIPAIGLFWLISSQANALADAHSHERPGDFSATCNTYGVNDVPSITELKWNAMEEQLSISGNNIMAEEGLLSPGDDATHSVHYVTTFHHNESGDIKVLYMTFRRHHKASPDRYHGEPWQTIRSLRIEMREDGNGYIQTYEAADIEGILTINSYTYLGECSYTGSYANPKSR